MMTKWNEHKCIECGDVYNWETSQSVATNSRGRTDEVLLLTLASRCPSCAREHVFQLRRHHDDIHVTEFSCDTRGGNRVMRKPLGLGG